MKRLRVFEDDYTETRRLLKQQLQQDVEAIRSAYAAQIDGLRQTLNDLRQEYNAQRDDIDLQLEQLRAERSAEIQTAKLAYKQQLADLR